MDADVPEQQIATVEGDGKDKAGEGADAGDDEFHEGRSGLAADVGDAAEDKEGDAFDGDAAVDGEDAMGKFVDENGDEEEDGGDGAYQPLLRRRPEGVAVAHAVGEEEGDEG